MSVVKLFVRTPEGDDGRRWKSGGIVWGCEGAPTQKESYGTHIYEVEAYTPLRAQGEYPLDPDEVNSDFVWGRLPDGQTPIKGETWYAVRAETIFERKKIK